MSYAEHGPRIFLANRHNSVTPLMYGDYVLPKKRLEGRLKLHDSCSDIRAWSPNSLENSRYFRELSEHDSAVGKIIPFNVVIDNIIRCNSQAQSELQEIKRELQKYRSLKLTAKQKEQLQNLDNTSNDLSHKNRYSTDILKNVFFDTYKSGSIIPTNSCLSIHIPCEGYFINNSKNAKTIRNQSNQSYSCSINETDVEPSSNNYNLISSCRSSMKLLPLSDCSEKASSWMEYIDVALQVQKETRDMEVQIDDRVDKCLNKITSVTAISQTSSEESKFSEADNNELMLDNSNLQINKIKEQSFECDASYSQSTNDISSPSESNNEIISYSDFDLHNATLKRLIIEKDSEIIALKNELCVREAEEEELRDINKHLEVLLKEKEDYMYSQQGNLTILHDKLLKLDHERNLEIEDLKKRICYYKYLMKQLKQELSEKCENCYLQSQKIEKMQIEKHTFLAELQEFQHRAQKAENCSVTLEQLKNALQDKDELEKQNYEQSCILAGQKYDLNQLLKLIKEMSVTHNKQLETKGMLKDLKIEVEEKDKRIQQYEDQLSSMKQEISEFFNSLKNTLNNWEDLNEECEGICSCTTCDLDINEESNNILYNIHIIMTRFQSYKIESQNLLQQVEDMKHYIENDQCQTSRTQNLRNIIYQDFYYDSKVATGDSTGKDNDFTLDIRQNKNNIREVECQDNFNSANSKNSLYDGTNIIDSRGLIKECQNYIIKMRKMNNMDKEEKEIFEYFAHFLLKFRSLTQKLQVYAELERPLLMKQIYYFYEVLKDTQSAINTTEDVTLKKQLMSNLYYQHKEEQKKFNSHIKHVPNNLLQVQDKINGFIEVILYRLLNEILYAEKKDLHDTKIDHAFETHLKFCIDRISTALQGAGDQRMQIVEAMEKQLNELQKKDIEIANLKNEVAQQSVCIGEGDGLNEEKSETNVVIKEQLLCVTEELNKKNLLMLTLEEQFKILKDKLSAYDKDCTALKKMNKSLKNVKCKLVKECQYNKDQLLIKNKKIKHLMQQSRKLFKTKRLKISLERNMTVMEKELYHLRSENSESENRLMQANMIISRKDEIINKLENKIDKNDSILPQKVAEYEHVMAQKHREITRLEEENRLLHKEVQSIENRLAQMNHTILSLTEQNDKVNIIHSMQEDLAKLDKSEKKLKIELNNLRVQLLSDQNSNRKLNENLDNFVQENEILKKNLEYLKNENSELSTRLRNEMIEEKLRNKLRDFSNKIYEKIQMLKNQFDIEKNLLTNEFNKNLPDKYMHHRQRVELKNHSLSKDLTPDSIDRTRENEIEKLETQFNSPCIKEKILKSDFITYGQLNSSENIRLKMRYELKFPENEHSESQNEIEILLNEIEVKNAEIKHHKEVIKHLAQENADLRAVLKSQIEEYQDKLILMKKNYDSSLNALCERHKANVDILQKQFEDNMKNERSFDSESWLQSLSMEELMELHVRINTIVNGNRKLIHIENENQYLRNNDARNQFYMKTNDTERMFQLIPTNIYDKEIFDSKETTPNKIVPPVLKEENSHLQNQWQFIALGDSQKYITSQTQDDKSKLEYNYGYLNNEGRPPISIAENKYTKGKHTEQKNSSFDKQRWNFINQCSAYHKLSNAFEYSRILRTD